MTLLECPTSVRKITCLYHTKNSSGHNDVCFVLRLKLGNIKKSANNAAVASTNFTSKDPNLKYEGQMFIDSDAAS